MFRICVVHTLFQKLYQFPKRPESQEGFRVPHDGMAGGGIQAKYLALPMRKLLLLLILCLFGHSHLSAALPAWDSLWVRYQGSNGIQEHSFALNGLYKKGELVFASKWDGPALRMILRSVQPIELLEMKLAGRLTLAAEDRILCNGFQSWSSSREYKAGDHIPRLSPVARPFARHYGDFLYRPRKDQKRLHSWTWTWIRDESYPSIDFIGSLDDHQAYTSFEFFTENGRIEANRDVAGWQGDEFSWNLMQLSGSQTEIFKQYGAALGSGPANPAKPVTGWTSWYNYYTDISESLLLHSLNAIETSGIPQEIFQIDDGFQSETGDWLDIDAQKFPRGMKVLADSIHAKEMKAGLWLAPYICSKKSRLFREHPDWIVRDAKGKLLKAGVNPGWGGAYYVLNFYHPEVKSYLKRVFDKVLQDWGYDLIKADFLFAACIQARNGKSRAGVMSDAMGLLRELCGDKLLLGCGVPLAPAFGKVDYCRIGNDIHLKWEWKALKALHLSERISTAASLANSLNRAGLSYAAFGNDPDVFILRKENNKLSETQKETLFILNHLLGSLVFNSDDLSTYDAGQLRLMRSAYPHLPKTMLNILASGDLYSVEFEIGSRQYVCLSNLSRKEATFTLKRGLWFETRAEGKHPITLHDRTGAHDFNFPSLKPYETRIFQKLNPETIQVLGGHGHIFPGSEVISLEKEEKGKFILQFYPDANTTEAVYLYFPEGETPAQCQVNGKTCTEVEIKGKKLWKFQP